MSNFDIILVGDEWPRNDAILNYREIHCIIVLPVNIITTANVNDFKREKLVKIT